MRRRILIFILIVQSILFVVHFFLYITWSSFWGQLSSSATTELRLVMTLLSICFVPATLLARRYSGLAMRVFYTFSAVWLGFVNFAFCGAGACWMFLGALAALRLHPDRRVLLEVFLILAILATLYGIANASRIRVSRVTVRMPNLPESWNGRVAGVISDLHLGAIWNFGFMRRVVALLASLQPDIIFIVGDLFDGLAIDLDRVCSPWREIEPRLGVYFVTGNHDEFSDSTKYVDTLERVGVRVLNDEKIVVEGLQIVGVRYRDTANGERFQSVLQRAALDRNQASVLLSHDPQRLSIPEAAGISLQLSGHTHGGQFFPFTRIVSRIYKEYAHGLHRFGNLMVYTIYGTGTWGPPLRVGTKAEILLIRFER